MYLLYQMKEFFLNGETEFAGMLVVKGLQDTIDKVMVDVKKVGVGDVLIGVQPQQRIIMEQIKLPHIKDKLIEMIHLNETLYSCGIACSCEGCQNQIWKLSNSCACQWQCKAKYNKIPLWEIARLQKILLRWTYGKLCLLEKDLRDPKMSL